jgi:hypothetical protein
MQVRFVNENAMSTRSQNKNALRIFAHDPGSKNYGFSIVEGRLIDDRVKFDVLINGLCPCPINNLKDHRERQEQSRAFLEWATEMVDRWKPRGIYGERYMTRGIKGPTVEAVNMMLGLLQSLGLPDAYIPAAVWKNAVARHGIELKDEYRLCKTAPHQLDASLIGVYALHQALGQKDFGTMGRKRFYRLMTQVEDTSTAKLYNRKNER